MLLLRRLLELEDVEASEVCRVKVNRVVSMWLHMEILEPEQEKKGQILLTRRCSVPSAGGSSFQGAAVAGPLTPPLSQTL